MLRGNLNRLTKIILSAIIFFTSCDKDDSIVSENEISLDTDIAIPVVNSDSCYLVLNNYDIIYAEGLSHDAYSASPFSIPLNLILFRAKKP